MHPQMIWLRFIQSHANTAHDMHTTRDMSAHANGTLPHSQPPGKPLLVQYLLYRQMEICDHLKKLELVIQGDPSKRSRGWGIAIKEV